MLAFITGASSGLGKEIARCLSEKGYDLIITARDEEKLLELKEELKTDVTVIVADLRKTQEVFNLYEKIKEKDIDVFVNNAGFGMIGEFYKTDLEKEIEMIKVNDVAMHILFKLILKTMISVNNNNEKERYILNVSSLSGFTPGPFMVTYYASKAYILNLTLGVYKEMKIKKSNINISVLCPGPIYTNFCDRAGVEFKTKYLTSEYVAKYSIDKMLGKKLVIIPGFLNKCGHVLAKILPSKLVMIVTSKIQKKKMNAI